ncbi:hypothetical protein IFM89_000572 [Coptis chinensis]|uniref:Uncharacterized protein n=1 Tax=Coptis chinensis TaxID=261450 RepID=A0A835IJC8_9MAGN|nr:hypothetical protein IFM89_000572 [Coptis chinensis]
MSCCNQGRRRRRRKKNILVSSSLHFDENGWDMRVNERVSSNKGTLEDSEIVYENMEELDVISWNSIITANAQNGYRD